MGILQDFGCQVLAVYQEFSLFTCFWSFFNVFCCFLVILAVFWVQFLQCVQARNGIFFVLILVYLLVFARIQSIYLVSVFYCGTMGFSFTFFDISVFTWILCFFGLFSTFFAVFGVLFVFFGHFGCFLGPIFTTCFRGDGPTFFPDIYRFYLFLSKLSLFTWFQRFIAELWGFLSRFLILVYLLRFSAFSTFFGLFSTFLSNFRGFQGYFWPFFAVL